MKKVTSICVYCGSSSGNLDVYREAANRLGRDLAAADIRLVYGGGSTGLMGEVARACLQAGGKVTGIIPRFLVEREVMLREVDDLIVTDDMHQRKMLMFERADGFVALPGGIGTLEETVEMLTWLQLGQHAKPVVIANIEGFWDPFADLVGHMSAAGFIREDMDVVLTAVGTADGIVEAVIDMASRMDQTGQPGGAPSRSNL